ncbi:hypothetical protein [Salinigranum salinum]|uniref:hypothetical protein n=1 Tax=Salinigranum salinum TaxID=1364937 RepID=UPI001865398C|nr:hypothetical protein [Salinigranum salinum]
MSDDYDDYDDYDDVSDDYDDYDDVSDDFEVAEGADPNDMSLVESDPDDPDPNAVRHPKFGGGYYVTLPNGSTGYRWSNGDVTNQNGDIVDYQP